MFKNYLTTAWRNIIKNGMFSAITIFGLAIGLMSCILILLFVREEVGYDTWVPDNDRIVRMHTGYIETTRPSFLTVRSAGRMMPAVRDYATNEIEAGVRLFQWGLTIRKDGDALPERLTFVDDSFFKVFDLPFLHGEQLTSFANHNDMLVTESMAIKHFGRTDVVGETMTVCCMMTREPNVFKITGVIKDIPSNSHMTLDIIVNMDPEMFADDTSLLQTWTSVNLYTYFKLREGVTVAQAQERLTYWVDNESAFVEMFKERAENRGDDPTKGKVSDKMKHNLMALTDLHLKARPAAGTMGDLTPMGDINMIYTFMGVAGLVLVIACINFMNLATARASSRAREVAMRKVMGATRAQVSIQFLGEAVAVAFIALVFALAGVEATLPFYNEALGRELELNLFNDFDLLLTFIGVAAFVGLGAGFYPALVLSRFLPAVTLKSNKSAEASGTMSLRSILVIFQFAISITLTVSTAVVYGQTLFANSMDMGYESGGKLVLSTRSAGDNVDAMKQQISSLSGVSSVVLSSEAPSQDYENNTYFERLDRDEGDSDSEGKVINYHNMGFGFFEAYDVKPIAGRLFDEAYGSDEIAPIVEGVERVGTASLILNESAVRTLGYATPDEAIGKHIAVYLTRSDKQNLQIIGVIPDLYFRSIKFGVRPSAYMMRPDRFRVATISYTTNDIQGLMDDVERIWKTNVPMQPINLQHLDEMMAAQYAEETAQAKLFAAFSALAILVACLGLYGLAAFTAERRTKEIGVRKVLGAKVIDIVRLLVWQFSKPVMIANVIAWPVAFYFMSEWLQGFEYRLGGEYIIMMSLVAGGIALVIAWATVASRAYRVATTNPIKALRYE